MSTTSRKVFLTNQQRMTVKKYMLRHKNKPYRELVTDLAGKYKITLTEKNYRNIRKATMADLKAKAEANPTQRKFENNIHMYLSRCFQQESRQKSNVSSC